MAISFPATLDLLEKLDKLIQFQQETDIRQGIERLWEPLEEYLRSILVLDNLAFFLLERETQEFVLQSVSDNGDRKSIEEEMDYLVESGTLAWVLKRRQPSLIPPFKLSERSLIILPFVTLRSTYGVAMLLSTMKWEEITYESMTLLSLLSRQVGLMLENMEAYNMLAKEHEDLLEAQERILIAEKMASVGRLASRASHEILNPLNVILGNAQLIVAKDKGQGIYSKYANRIIDHGLRIEAIVRALLKASDYSTMPKVVVDLSKLVQRAWRVTKAEAEKINVQLEIDIPNAPILVWGSEVALLESLVSILRNSFEAMPDGGKVNVKVLEQKEEQTALISITDTGTGIPQEVADKILEPFFTTKDGNLGMGLYLVYSIIEDHKGKISFESDPGQGTRVSIILPIYRERIQGT